MRRNVIPPEELLLIGTGHGAVALGLEAWPQTAVELDHPALAGVPQSEVESALVFGCGADVFSP